MMFTMMMPILVCLVYALFKYGDNVGHSGYSDYSTVAANADVELFFMAIRAQLSEALAKQ